MFGWVDVLQENPFARALEVVSEVKRGAKCLESEPATTSPKAQKASPKAPESQALAADKPTSDKDRREELKLQQYLRQFEEQAAKEERRKKLKAAKQEREERDPCTCGRSKTKRLPKPLCAGGARCNACSPLVLARDPPELRDAPLFHPTEEEFVDPMAYIRSIQVKSRQKMGGGEGGRVEPLRVRGGGRSPHASAYDCCLVAQENRPEKLQ